MSEFKKQFLKITELCSKYNITDYKQLVELLKLNLVSLNRLTEKEAIIILGFSGNGKSTWAKDFCQENKDYHIFSWDDVIIDTMNKKKTTNLTQDEHITAISEELDSCSNQNLVLDGNYLNLPLRVALINTLHEMGYSISIVDLTNKIDEILPFRIEAETTRYHQHPKFSKYPYDTVKEYVTKKIYEFKEDEEQRSAFSEQIKQDVVSLGVEKVMDSNTIKKENSSTHSKK